MYVIHDGIQTRLPLSVATLKSKVPVDGHSQHYTHALCGLIILRQIQFAHLFQICDLVSYATLDKYQRQSIQCFNFYSRKLV